MAGLITSDLEETVNPQKTPLIVEECLGEFNEGQKALARENLDVYAKESVYNRQESDIKLDESIKKAFEKYLNEEDPHGILPIVRLMIEGFVKEDGSTPFTAPQGGVDPVQDFHLATKRFVTKILRDHINDDDPHRILPQVEDMLEQYVKQADVYFKTLLYTKNEIDSQSGKYIKKDGSTSFTKALVGVDPQIDSHLATKRYVDKVIYNHLVDIDPHGFVALLNKRLASYAKANNVYDKSQTYSRVQIDSIIRGLVNDAAKEAIIDHLNEFDPHNILAEVRKERYIKQDGTIPFRAPLKGVDATTQNELATLGQVQEIQQILSNKIESKECEWRTSGPVIGSAGLVETGTEFANTVSFLEIMDAIFYGKGIAITATELVSVGNTSQVTVCVLGSLASFEHGELYQDDILILTFTKRDFEELSCITVNSLQIEHNTKFIFKVFYVNNSFHEVSAITKIAMPVFVGLLPKWKFGNTITYDYLMELYQEDSINNKFYDKSAEMSRLDHKYQFFGKDLKHILVAVPITYPNLYLMSIPSLQFGIEAFDVIDSIPFKVPGSDNDIIYKLYIYTQAITLLNNPITFNFIKENE